MANYDQQPTWEERIEAIHKGLELLGFKREDHRKQKSMTREEFREWADVLNVKIAQLLVAAKGHEGECEG